MCVHSHSVCEKETSSVYRLIFFYHGLTRIYVLYSDVGKFLHTVNFSQCFFFHFIYRCCVARDFSGCVYANALEPCMTFLINREIHFLIRKNQWNIKFEVALAQYSSPCVHVNEYVRTWCVRFTLYVRVNKSEAVKQ